MGDEYNIGGKKKPVVVGKMSISRDSSFKQAKSIARDILKPDGGRLERMMGAGGKSLPVEPQLKKKLWGEFDNLRKDARRMKELGGNVNALEYLLNDGFEALKNGQFGSANTILSNSYAIIERLKGGLRGRSAREKHLLSKRQVEKLHMMGIEVEELQTRLVSCEMLLRNSNYIDAIARAEEILEDCDIRKDNFYKSRLEASMEGIQVRIEQLVSRGVECAFETTLFQQARDKMNEKHYIGSENILSDISAMVNRKEATAQQDLAPSLISKLESQMVYQSSRELPVQHLQEILDRAKNALRREDYPLVSELYRRGMDHSEKLLNRHYISECRIRGKKIELLLDEFMGLGGNIDGFRKSYDEGLNALKEGEYHRARNILNDVQDTLQDNVDGIKVGMARQMWELSEALLGELKREGVNPVKGEILLRAAEIKLKSAPVPDILDAVKRAHDHIQDEKANLYRKRPLNALVKMHSQVKQLKINGVDTSLLEGKLMSIKNRIEEGDFQDLKTLFENIERDIENKKKEFRSNRFARMLEATEKRIEELERQGANTNVLREMQEDAFRLLDEGEFSVVEIKLKQMDGDIKLLYRKSKVPHLRENIVELENKIPYWQKASLDTSILEELILEATNYIDNDEIDRAYRDLQRANDVAKQLEGSYQQERILELILITKTIFPELSDAGQDIILMQKELDRMVQMFEEEKVPIAFELSERIRDMLEEKKSVVDLERKRKSLLENCKDLAEKGVNTDEIEEILHKFTSHFQKGELSRVKEEFGKVEENINALYFDHCSEEINLFEKRLDELSEIGVNVTTLHTFVEKARTRLEKNDFNNTFSCLATAWDKTRDAYDVFVSNDLLARLYELEDELFDMVKNGALVKDIDEGLLEIKRDIDGGRFEIAESKLLQRKKHIEDSKRELKIEKISMFMEKSRKSLVKFQEAGLDVVDFVSGLSVLKEYYDAGALEEADDELDILQKLFDGLDRELQLKEIGDLLDRIREELTTMEGRDLDISLVREYFQNALEFMEKGELESAKERCHFALEEAERKGKQDILYRGFQKLERIGHVLELISEDIGEEPSLANYFQRAERLQQMTIEQANDDFTDKVEVLEADVQKINHAHLEKKAQLAAGDLASLIEKVSALGGDATGARNLFSRAEELFSQECFEPSLQMYGKGVVEATSEIAKQEVLDSISQVKARLANMQDAGMEMTKEVELVESITGEWNLGNYSRCDGLLRQIYEMMDEAEFDFNRNRVTNKLSSLKQQYRGILERGVPADNLRRPLDILEESEQLLAQRSLEVAEALMTQVGEKFIREQEVYNVRDIKRKTEAALYVCEEINAIGAQVSSSIELLSGMQDEFRGRATLSDEEYLRYVENVEHALASAREQELAFDLSLLDKKIEETEALIDENEAQGIDMGGSVDILEAALALKAGNDAKGAMSKLDESMEMAHKLNVEFFKKDSEKIMLTLKGLVKTVSKLGGEKLHLDEIITEAKDLYTRGEYRDCSLKLRALKKVCNEKILAHTLGEKILELKGRIEKSPFRDDDILIEVEVVEGKVDAGELEMAEQLLGKVIAVFDEKRRKYFQEKTRDHILKTNEELNKLSTGNIDQGEAFMHIQKARALLKAGELEMAYRFATESLEMARRNWEVRGEHIKEAILSLEKTVVEGGRRNGWDGQIINELDKLYNDVFIMKTQDIQKMVFSFATFLEKEQEFHEKRRFLEKLSIVKAFFDNISPYLPANTVLNISNRIENISFFKGKAFGKGQDIHTGRVEELGDHLKQVAESVVETTAQDAQNMLDEVGGISTMKARGIEGVDVYEFFKREFEKIPADDIVWRLKDVRSLRSMALKLKKRMLRIILATRYEGLKEKLVSLDDGSPFFREMSESLDSARVSLSKDNVDDAERHVDRALESMVAGKKAKKRKKSRSLVEKTLENIREIGIVMEDEEVLRDIFIQTKAAAKDGQYSLVEKNCVKMVSMSTQLVKDRFKQEVRENIETLNELIVKRSGILDLTRFEEHLMQAKRSWAAGNFRAAKNVATAAQQKVEKQVAKYMCEKLAKKFHKSRALVNAAKSSDVDVAYPNELLDRAKYRLDMGEWREAKLLLSEAVEKAKKLVRDKRLEDLQKFASSIADDFREVEKEVEKEGAGMKDAWVAHRQMLEHLNRGNIEGAQNLKMKLKSMLEDARKTSMVAKINATMIRYSSLVGEIGAFQGDVSEFEREKTEVRTLMEGGSIEGALELSDRCLESVQSKLVEVLRTRADMVMDATKEIIKSSENVLAEEIYIRAKKSFEQGEYRKALEFAQQAIKTA